MSRAVDKIELVETHTLALSLKRLQDGSKNGYDNGRWKRALYHALAMSDTGDFAFRKAVREALALP